MNKIRWFLVKILVGDASYIRNCTIQGKVSVREDHWVCGCTFVNDSYVEAPNGARFPKEKAGE